jgi:wyosine [tRNA(Phe)-imidazoG37] synthetase (radical SAM superfamily)
VGRIKKMTDVPVAVLTNGALLWQEDVRRQLMHADLVIPSLDAGDEITFRRVNRPHEAISFEQMLGGLIDFRHVYPGGYWLEVFVLANYTALPDEFAKIVRCVHEIQPHRVQLNTIARPAAEPFAVAASRQQLTKLAQTLSPPAEVIANFRGLDQQLEFTAGRQEIIDMVRRRPCTIPDIAHGLAMHQQEAIKHVEHLVRQGCLEKFVREDQVYYRIVRQPCGA